MTDSPTASMTTSFTSSSTPITYSHSIMTPFTPPSYCTNVIKSSCTLTTPSSGSSTGTPTTSCAYVERDLTCGSDGQATRASECFPGSPYPYSVLTYSPAVGCPSGWGTQSQIIDPSSRTTAVCCPSGYTAHSYYSSCASSITYTDSSTAVLSCQTDGSSVPDWFTSDYYNDNTAVWALRIEAILTASSSPDATFTPLSEPTLDFGEPKSNPPDPSQKSSRLGAGPIAGIAVGAVGALALVGGLLFLWRRRQNQHHHAPIPKASPSGEHDALPEFVGKNGTISPPTPMVSSNGLFHPQPEVRSPMLETPLTPRR
ncbi:hypothetical protein BKA58DRAFT_199229 [Alternaria rosae]|uniref:uncharacterized protein n=1 Tax=Alternaria rosae TaxID=1187941 RepID=UPI001E8D94B8|nr:uncharacterized protein BKA58DRAFT_199229 [Alternaria rosae]KAH6868693.1 hypothetical protein BKA58DRAFT_199229 [Alternaria rosae]